MDLGTFHENVDKDKKETNWAEIEDDENGGNSGEPDGNRDQQDNYERRGSNYERRDDRGARYERQGDDRRGSYDRRGGNSYERRGGDDRRGERREDRNRVDTPQKPLPDRPPYIAYVGNLAYEVVDAELNDFFSEYCKVTNVRILTDKETGRSKGFGYVTFADRESLQTALAANGEEIERRKIRVDVAEDMTSSGDRDFKERRAPPQASRADAVDRWERGVTVPTKEIPPSRYGRSDRDSDRGDRGDRSDRNDRNDRGYERGDRGDRGYERRNYAPAGERKPLDLKPRTAPLNTSADSNAAPKPAAKSNPFGDAKPRDEAAAKKREQEVADKLKNEQQQQKEADPKPAPAPKKTYQPPRNSDRGGKPQNKSGGNKSAAKAQSVPKKYTTVNAKETKIATSNAFGDLNASVD